MAVMVQLHTPVDLTHWKTVHGACPDVILPLVQWPLSSTLRSKKFISVQEKGAHLLGAQMEKSSILCRYCNILNVLYCSVMLLNVPYTKGWLTARPIRKYCHVGCCRTFPFNIFTAAILMQS